LARDLSPPNQPPALIRRSPISVKSFKINLLRKSSFAASASLAETYLFAVNLQPDPATAPGGTLRRSPISVKSFQINPLRKSSLAASASFARDLSLRSQSPALIPATAPGGTLRRSPISVKSFKLILLRKSSLRSPRAWRETYLFAVNLQPGSSHSPGWDAQAIANSVKSFKLIS